jgi:hypothetical protein
MPACFTEYPEYHISEANPQIKGKPPDIVYRFILLSEINVGKTFPIHWLIYRIAFIVYQSPKGVNQIPDILFPPLSRSTLLLFLRLTPIRQFVYDDPLSVDNR